MNIMKCNISYFQMLALLWLFAQLSSFACSKTWSGSASSSMTTSSTQHILSGNSIAFMKAAIGPVSNNYYYLYCLNPPNNDTTVIRRANADETTAWTYTRNATPSPKILLVDETETFVYFADSAVPAQVNILNATTGAVYLNVWL